MSLPAKAICAATSCPSCPGPQEEAQGKLQRIEAVSPLWERGLVYYNEAKRNDTDMKTGIDQTLSLARGSRAHDDAPDADEGAIYKLQKASREERFEPIFGERPTPKGAW